MDSEKKKVRFIISFLYFCIIVIITYFGVKYLLAPLLPFICAFLICSASRNIFLFFEKRIHSKKIVSLLVTFLFVLLTCFCLFILFFGVANRLSSLSQSINYDEIEENYEKILSTVKVFFEKICRKSRLFSKIYSAVSLLFYDFAGNLSSFLSEAIPGIISACVQFISFFPACVIFLFMTFVATFYIGIDFERIHDFLLLQISDSAKNILEEIKSTLSFTAKAMFKSYFLLTLITFFQLLCGLSVLRIKYSLHLAIIISFVDLLPILGTGTILIPWSVICFITQNTARGIGIALLYVIIFIFRRIAEPKIIGDGIGLSPLLSLICIFVGFKIWGFIGILVFPFLILTVIKLNEKGFIALYRVKCDKSPQKVQKAKERFLNFKADDNQKN